MTNTSKGQSKEKACADALEAEGWVVEFRSTRTKYQRIDLGYRPTKEERDTCACGDPKTMHHPSGHCEGFKCEPHDFRMKKLTGWKAAKFDVEAIKDGQIIRISVKNSNNMGNFAEEKRNLADYIKHYDLNPAYFCIALWIWHEGRWRGRGKAKHFEQAHWDKEEII